MKKNGVRGGTKNEGWITKNDLSLHKIKDVMKRLWIFWQLNQRDNGMYMSCENDMFCGVKCSLKILDYVLKIENFDSENPTLEY